MFKRGIRAILSVLFVLTAPLAASAAQGDILLARMTVLREIGSGGSWDYEVQGPAGMILLKTPPFRLGKGQEVCFFVREISLKSGNPAYVVLSAGKPRSFSEGFAAVEYGGVWNYTDKNGKLLLTEGSVAKALDFSGGFAFCKIVDSYGYVGRNGEVLETPALDLFDEQKAQPWETLRAGFSEGVAVGKAERNDGGNIAVLLDSSGQVITRIEQPGIKDIAPFSEGLAVFKGPADRAESGAYYGFLDRAGKVVISPQYRSATSFRNGLAAVWTLSGKFAYIDKTGKMVTGADFDEATEFSEGFAAVRRGRSWGFVDTSGKIATATIYDDVRPYREGLAAVKTGGKWGFVGSSGTRIPPTFDEVKDFSEGLAAVSSNGVWGYIDTNGSYIVEPRYKSAEPFSREGLALVEEAAPRSGTKWQYVDKRGGVVLWFYAYR